MTEFIYETHSGLRWLVVLMTLVALVWLLMRYLQNQAYDKRTHLIMASWAGLVGLQWLVGIVLLVALGTYTGMQWSHAGTMTIALAVSHGYIPLKKRPDKMRYLGGLASIVIVGLLVFVGVQLVNGWS